MQDAGWTSADTISLRTVEELKSLGISGRKSEYLIDLAKAVTSGTLDIETAKMMFSRRHAQFREILTSHGFRELTADNYRLSLLYQILMPGLVMI